jgi:hypothetical protein
MPGSIDEATKKAGSASRRCISIREIRIECIAASKLGG